MKVADYIVEFFIKKGITDVFGYPGGMVTHLMDSFAKYQNKIKAHVTYHEQGAAFAACGYAQVSGKPGVAYSTSGPGATNLITGICNSFFDSIPTIFITGQVNLQEAKGNYLVRQRGFQETDIVSIVKPVTKYARYIDSKESLITSLDEAYKIAVSGRMGPVLLDVPMNIFKEDISTSSLNCLKKTETTSADGTLNNDIVAILERELNSSKCPCLIVGNGVKISNTGDKIRTFANKYKIPVVTSMIAFDVLQNDDFNYGFIGAYGSRVANFIVAKSDLIISVGSRLDIRQVGKNRDNFAPNAKIIRFDVDQGELDYAVHSDEIHFCVEMKEIADIWNFINVKRNYSLWITVCDKIKSLLSTVDYNHISNVVSTISEFVPGNSVITTDVGQNQVWIAQSFKLKYGQKVLFSGGHGAMGYSLPAAIGACLASGGKMTVCFSGDGGLQMNIQELQFIAREKLPIKIIVFNNNSLGMIRHFQEMYFKKLYFQTKPEGGYTAPDFKKVACAYGIESIQFDSKNIVNEIDVVKHFFETDCPSLLEIIIDEDTYVVPKLQFGKPNQDQEPPIDRDLYKDIMNLKLDE